MHKAPGCNIYHPPGILQERSRELWCMIHNSVSGEKVINRSTGEEEENETSLMD